MDWIQQFGVDAGKVFSTLGIDAASLMRTSKGDERTLTMSAIPWTLREYAAFQLASGGAFCLAFAVLCTFLYAFFGIQPSFFLLAVPCGVFGVLAARLHVFRVAGSREAEVDSNLLAALREMEGELRGGKTVWSALGTVACGGNGRASELFSEALARAREGAPFESALSEAAEKTESAAFKAFAASAAHAHASGRDFSGCVAAAMQEIETGKKRALSTYANECSILSTVTVVFTGVLPGMLVLAFAQGGYLLSMRAPVELFVAAYVLAFPILKYTLQAKLALAGRGVGR